jgi:hypothetical protein
MTPETYNTAINDLVVDILPILAKHHRAELEQVLATARERLEMAGGQRLSPTPNTRAAAIRAEIKMLEAALA